MYSWRGILIFLLPLCLRLGAQQASLNGVVVNVTAKEPLAWVHVTVSLIPKFPDPNQPYGATSGPDGRFSIPNLPPGVYQLLARHNGFLYLEAEHSDASAAVLTLKPAETVTDRVVQMTPEAIPSGRVVDEYGDSVERASIRASPVGADSSTSAVLQGVTALTDERGLFRIEDAPGKFRIAATTLSRMGAHEVRTDVASFRCMRKPGLRPPKARTALRWWKPSPAVKRRVSIFDWSGNAA